MKNIVTLLLVCILCCGLFAACGGTAQPAETSALPSAISETLEDGVYTMPSELANLTAAETMDSADVTCAPLERDGKVIGFEMRFLQSPKLDALFSDRENMYFGVVKCGKKAIGIPMEQVRILTDRETDEFVLTLLLPSGEKLSGKACTASFYTAKRNAQTGDALLCAKKEISLP